MADLLDLKVQICWDPNTKSALGVGGQQLISNFVSETGLFTLCNCLFSYSYRLSGSTREEKKKKVPWW